MEMAMLDAANMNPGITLVGAGTRTNHPTSTEIPTMVATRLAVHKKAAHTRGLPRLISKDEKAASRLILWRKRRREKYPKFPCLICLIYFQY